MLRRLRRAPFALSGAVLSGIAIVPPVITWTGDTSDTTPDFDIDLSSGLGAPRDAAAGDVFHEQYSPDSGATWNDYLLHTLTSGDIAGTPFTVSGVSPLANGTFPFRARLERGSITSAWSASVSVTVSASAT